MLFYIDVWMENCAIALLGVVIDEYDLYIVGLKNANKLVSAHFRLFEFLRVVAGDEWNNCLSGEMGRV